MVRRLSYYCALAFRLQSIKLYIPDIFIFLDHRYKYLDVPDVLLPHSSQLNQSLKKDINLIQMEFDFKLFNQAYGFHDRLYAF